MSCTVGCPYEGEIAGPSVWPTWPGCSRVLVQRVDVADTIGVGTPRKVQHAIEAALQHYAIDEVSGHFHDTMARRCPTRWPRWRWGCGTSSPPWRAWAVVPYAKGATGNVATEDVVYMLHGMGIATGIDLDKLIDAGAYISDFLGASPTRVHPRC